MEGLDTQDFKNFVYKDLKNAISLALEDLTKSFNSDWQLYEETEIEKLELIDSKLKETREHLVRSEFKVQFPLDVIKDNLSIELKNYCNSLPVYITANELSYIGDQNVENLFGFFLAKRGGVKFYRYSTDMEYLSTLVEHIALYKFYIELKKLKAEILEKSAIEPLKVLRETSRESLVEEEENPYHRDCQHIFKNPKAHRIFEYLHANLAVKKNPSANYAFIFRRMQKDEFIYEDIKEKTFRDFLSRYWNIEIDSKLKPDGYSVTELKEKIYSNAVRSK